MDGNIKKTIEQTNVTMNTMVDMHTSLQASAQPESDLTKYTSYRNELEPDDQSFGADEIDLGVSAVGEEDFDPEDLLKSPLFNGSATLFNDSANLQMNKSVTNDDSFGSLGAGSISDRGLNILTSSSPDHSIGVAYNDIGDNKVHEMRENKISSLFASDSYDLHQSDEMQPQDFEPIPQSDLSSIKNDNSFVPSYPDSHSHQSTMQTQQQQQQQQQHALQSQNTPTQHMIMPQQQAQIQSTTLQQDPSSDPICQQQFQRQWLQQSNVSTEQQQGLFAEQDFKQQFQQVRQSPIQQPRSNNPMCSFQKMQQQQQQQRSSGDLMLEQELQLAEKQLEQQLRQKQQLRRSDHPGSISCLNQTVHGTGNSVLMRDIVPGSAVFKQPLSQSMHNQLSRTDMRSASFHAREFKSSFGGVAGSRNNIPVTGSAELKKLNVSALSEETSQQRRQQQKDNNTQPACEAMEKLCETMKRSAMSRSLVKNLSRQNSGRSQLTRQSSSNSSRGLPLRKNSSHGASLTRPSLSRHSSARSSSGQQDGSDASIPIRSAPVRRVSSNAKHRLQTPTRGVLRHDSHLSHNSMHGSSHGIRLQVDGQNMGTF